MYMSAQHKIMVLADAMYRLVEIVSVVALTQKAFR